MDRAKVFKDYFVSSQNTVLLPNEDFGRRKFLNVGINRSLSLSRIEEIALNHTDEMRSSNKQWIHAPDALTRGHILYTVKMLSRSHQKSSGRKTITWLQRKWSFYDRICSNSAVQGEKFLGESEVEAPKGTDVVKDAIRKRKFTKSLRKTEGQKTPKVELSISIDGVTVQEPKTKIVKYQYPLHRISYCADDKSDKRMFTFIAKASDTNQHFCYVFGSDKNAEEITLTIGQAFDLAYRRFLETQGKDMESKKTQLLLQKKVETLEKENEALKMRIRELEILKDRSDIENYKRNKQISDLTRVTAATAGTVVTLNHAGESTSDSPVSSQPGSPKTMAVGRRLENLVFDAGSATTNGSMNGTPHSPRGAGIISPPPPSSRSRPGKHGNPGTPTTPATPSTPQQAPPQSFDYEDDLASVFMSPNVSLNSPLQQNNFNSNNVFDPFNSPSAPAPSQGPTDPFGMPTFTPTNGTGKDFDSAISKMDRDFLDLQAGFSQGLSFGTEEFGMNDFDPLKSGD